MPNNRIRSPWISSVSPSITAARPAISPEAAQVGELVTIASTKLRPCDQALRPERWEAREIIATWAPGRVGLARADAIGPQMDYLFQISRRPLYVRTIRTAERENLHALPRRDPAAHPRGGRGTSPADTYLGRSRRQSPDRAHLPVQRLCRGARLCEPGGALAESEGHHPDICFGWGYATVSLQTHKIKGLHENEFIMAAKLDRMADVAGSAGPT